MGGCGLVPVRLHTNSGVVLARATAPGLGRGGRARGPRSGGLRELRTVDWDVAVTDHGPVVVEGYAGAWPQPISSVPKLPKPGLADNQWSE